MSLEDRTEDVKFVDKPTEFKMSKEWERQWDCFEQLIESLMRRVIPAFGFHDSSIELTDSEQQFVINQPTDNFDAISKEGYSFSNYEETSLPHIELHTVRKHFLTFNRKANYEWQLNRAKEHVENYKTAAEGLVDFSQHLDLPEIAIPKNDESFITPFVKLAYVAIQEWLDERYDHVTRVVKKLPAKILIIVPRQRRMILGAGEDSPSVNHKAVEAYFCGDLLQLLSNIYETHDIESIFNRAKAGVEGIKRTFELED